MGAPALQGDHDRSRPITANLKEERETMTGSTWSRCAALAAGLCAASGALATSATFSGSSGALAASVRFDVTGSTLQVTLTNTSTHDVMVPADVLTAVFFDVSSPALSLTRTRAVLGAGSTVFFPPAGFPTGVDSNGEVGGEWAYDSGLAGTPGGGHYGISSSGLNWFGPPNLFPGDNLQGPDSPDGIQYGITSAGDNPATGNAPVTGSNALIHNSVVFTLGNLPAGFDPNSRISNITFQYGTATDEPSFHGNSTPTPGAAALLSLGLLGFAGRRRR
jgi:uncharacterized protein (TIGR03382 family)